MSWNGRHLAAWGKKRDGGILEGALRQDGDAGEPKANRAERAGCCEWVSVARDGG